MAIDAVIADVYEVEGGYRLELAPRHQTDVSYPSEPGQSFLVIDSPTWKPQAGMEIWGSGELEILWPGGKEKHVYYRPGYGTIYENFGRASSLAMDHWLQHGRARGEAKP